VERAIAQISAIIIVNQDILAGRYKIAVQK